MRKEGFWGEKDRRERGIVCRKEKDEGGRGDGREGSENEGKGVERGERMRNKVEVKKEENLRVGF